ncbi:MAG: hypothetical protein EBU90_13345 [Proteobacteria bacterium]|nr:hypothetical protein [Pseudomonadota bacterium]NBP15116.1 hypothetical protein [bacterium]
MKQFIHTYSDWLTEYKKNKTLTWFKVTLSDKLDYYFNQYEDWFDIKKICQSCKLNIISISLQYKSNSCNIDTIDADGVYLVRSALGAIGETTKQTITIGKLYNSIVYKTMWVVPELVEQLNDQDKIENCFEEAIIYNDKQKAETI